MLDSRTYTVSITANDKGDGTMTMKTAVNDGTTEKEYIDERAAAAFENTYDAGGNTNITVTVTDDRHGSLSVDIDYAEDAGGIEFVNAYGVGMEDL